MAEMTAEYDEIQVPDGGVASFMMSDEDIAALEREEDQQEVDEVYGGDGISQFTDIASQMAGLGRFGDDVIVHAQTGEIVIPKNILDDNPEIRDVVFQAMMAQGIEDPERYVVGSGSASINPETGLAEYWGISSFTKPFKKAASSIAKGVKKVASKTVKVLKKVAPIVLPIALAMTPLGPIYGAALGSGIGTLIQGGSFKDALKSAAISGLSGAAMSGFTGPGTFTENVSNAFANPGARFSQTMQGITGPEKFFRAYTPTPSAAPTSSTTGAATSTAPSANGEVISAQEQYASDILGGGEPLPQYADTQAFYDESIAFGQQRPDAGGMFASDMPPAQTYTGASGNTGISTDASLGTQQTRFSERIADAYNTAKEYATTGYDKGKELLFGGVEKTPTDLFNDPTFAPNVSNEALRYEMAKDAAAATQKNILQKVAPYALAGGALMYGTGMFDTPEPTPEEESPLGVKRSPTGVELFERDPSKFMVADLSPGQITYQTPTTSYQSFYDSYPYPYYGLQQSNPNLQSPFYRQPVQTAAEGGEIFPRRNGGIMPDEGVPGQDSVRAMLMPGEFVMTTDAVKGAGNGDLRRGINTMYNVMANLERKGRMA